VASAGAGAGDVTAIASLTRLAPFTTYHYRLVVTNLDGTATGADRTFRTQRIPFAGMTVLTKVTTVQKTVAGIRLVCPPTAIGTCRGTLSLSTTVKVRRNGGTTSKTVNLGSAGFAIAPRRAGIVKVTVPRDGLKLLRSRKTLKTRATAIAFDSRPAAKVTRGEVTLKAPG
jgi:hypothetical protein